MKDSCRVKTLTQTSLSKIVEIGSSYNRKCRYCIQVWLDLVQGVCDWFSLEI